MAEKLKAIFDSGPFIHLAQIGAARIISRKFSAVFIPETVFNEVARYELPGRKELLRARNVQRTPLNAKAKDYAKLVSEKYGLELAESEAIALSKQVGLRLFFTDDLAAREAAKELGLDAHGSLGIITRAFREKIITRADAIAFVRKLHADSTLFITTDIVRHVISKISAYKK